MRVQLRVSMCVCLLVYACVFCVFVLTLSESNPAFAFY